MTPVRCFLCLSGSILFSNASEIEHFESTLPATCSAESGNVSLSAARFKSGSSSLEWNWNSGTASLTLRDPSPAAKPRSKAGFAMWVYQERPIKAAMHFELLYQNKVLSTGWFQMDFTGWRILGCAYQQLAIPAGQAVDALRLKPPGGQARGRIFIDMAGLGLEYSATRSLQTPWVDVPDGLGHPDSVVLSAADPSLNRPWLPRKVARVDADQLSDIQTLERAFLNTRSAPGKGIPAGKLDELRKTIASYQIRREGGSICGRPVDGGSALKPDGFIPYGDYLKTCDAVRNAFYQAKEPAEADELKRMFVDLTAHLLDQGWAPGPRLTAFDNYPFAQYTCFYAMKDVLAEAGLARPVAQALIDSFGSHGPGDFAKEHPSSTMDGLGFWNRELYACSLMFPTSQEQLHHLLISQRFLNLALVEPNTIAPDGCTYHHGGFHYAYASYNMPRLLQSLEKVAPTRFRINAVAHERLKVFVRSLAFTSSRGEQACNLGMRAGTPMSTMGVEPVARMLAGMGTPDGKQKLDAEMAAISLRLLEEGQAGGPHPNFAKEPWKTWLARGIRPAAAPQGFLAMNGGPIAIHRGNGWLASISGMTSRYRCVEIYGWTQTNNYGRFARNGSLFITSTGNPPDFRQSGWSYDGWNWCHFPGTTAIRFPNECDIFDGYAMYGNSSAQVGGTHLGNDGVWGMDYSGFGVSFRKSYFCFGNRITAITTGIRAKDPKNAHPLATTLFQNSITPQSEFITVDGEPLKGYPHETTLTSEKSHWILDHKQTGYLLPAGNDSLKLSAMPQRWRYMTEKYLVDPKQNPISGDVTYQNVRGKIKDLSAIEKFYRPSEGNFALAWFDHGPRPAPASSVYTMVIKTTPDELRKLSAHPALTILRSDETAHIVHDLASGTFGHTIYQPSDLRSAGSPLRSCGEPCSLMIRLKDANLLLSLAYTAAGNSVPAEKKLEIRLVLDGKWRLYGKHAALRSRIAVDHTEVVVTPRFNTPILWQMEPP